MSRATLDPALLPEASGNGAPRGYEHSTAAELRKSAHANRREAKRAQRRARRQPAWKLGARGRKAQRFYAESTAAVLHDQLAAALEALEAGRRWRKRPPKVSDLSRKAVGKCYEAAGMKAPD